MQVSRMFEMLYILLENDRISAPELARRLEVSVRTVYRDAQALAEAGMPIYAERGREGGLSILPGHRLSRALLSDDDRRGILASLRAMAQAGAGEAETLRRMTAFLGTSAPDWVQIDLTDWSGRQDALLGTLKDAILSRRLLSFDYYGESGERTARRVCPQRLWFKGLTWYLLGYCLTRNAMRTFRLTRIRAAQIVPGEFPPEALAAMSAAPAQTDVASVPLLPVTLLIDARMAYRVYDDFDEAEITVRKDGHYLVQTAFPPGAWVLSFILGYGDAAQVLAPEALRSEVRAALQKTLALYEKRAVPAPTSEQPDQAVSPCDRRTTL